MDPTQRPSRSRGPSLLATLLVSCTLLSLHPATLVQARGASAAKGGSSSTSSSSSGTRTSTTTTTSSSHGTVYTRSSYGASTRTRVAGIIILSSFFLYNGYSYPSMRFVYDNGYYDECFLRNITSENGTIGSDSPVTLDQTAIDSFPTLVTSNATADSILAYNQTLYNQTNGLIVDPLYCNYTAVAQSGSGGAGSSASARMSALLIMAVGWLAVGAVFL